ncbi:CoxG family protein [Burkholderia singularis]|uniref:Carbon monoxide dehydrogenase G protein n=1 Tax=Burkholderia singularis TaxID=1503053 RepID=A0A238H4T5_9BURK|nr:carbon monoxide dehydrogenase [Burkholderia singularis]SMG00381.1 carbon monoxide dehydrogenase G protein [Burkholderia singularis]
MELHDALWIPLAPLVVRDALHDPALVRASLEYCEAFSRLSRDEFSVALSVPFGLLRARYEVRAHVVAGEHGDAPGSARHTLHFRARSDELGALRGQIDVSLPPAECAPREAGSAGRGGECDDLPAKPATRVEYAIWATAFGPLAELPVRQLRDALADLADDFFTEFGQIVLAKHGLAPNRARAGARARQHVFLRPASMTLGAKRSPAMSADGALTARAAGALGHRESSPLPPWAWAAMIVFVALLLYAVR